MKLKKCEFFFNFNITKINNPFLFEIKFNNTVQTFFENFENVLEVKIVDNLKNTEKLLSF